MQSVGQRRSKKIMAPTLQTLLVLQAHAYMHANQVFRIHDLGSSSLNRVIWFDENRLANRRWRGRRPGLRSPLLPPGVDYQGFLLADCRFGLQASA